MPRLDVDAISFDLFDTLIDSRIDLLTMVEVDGRRFPPTLAAIHEVIATHRPVSIHQLAEELGSLDRRLREEFHGTGRELPSYTRFRALAEALGFDDLVAGELAHRMVDAHMAILRAHTETPEHHEQLLAELHRHHRLALCSNFTHAPTALRLMEEQGLVRHFDVVVISETVGWRKPRPEIFAAVVDGLALSPERILHVGDRLEADVRGAARAGMQTGWLDRRVRDADDALRSYDGPSPDLRLRDLGDLAGLLG